MVPVYHCLYEERGLVLFCVPDGQLEAASISDLVTLDYICDIKVLIMYSILCDDALTVYDQTETKCKRGGV